MLQSIEGIQEGQTVPNALVFLTYQVERRRKRRYPLNHRNSAFKCRSNTKNLLTISATVWYMSYFLA